MSDAQLEAVEAELKEKCQALQQMTQQKEALEYRCTHLDHLMAAPADELQALRDEMVNDQVPKCFVGTEDRKDSSSTVREELELQYREAQQEQIKDLKAQLAARDLQVEDLQSHPTLTPTIPLTGRGSSDAIGGRRGEGGGAGEGTSNSDAGNRGGSAGPTGA